MGIGPIDFFDQRYGAYFPHADGQMIQMVIPTLPPLTS
jgi:hypothetical protein